jgi:hypothetical protein
MLTVGEMVTSFVFGQSLAHSVVGVGSFSDMTSQGGEKGSAARRRPKEAREAYSLYVERATEGANEADGPLSAPCKGWPC